MKTTTSGKTPSSSRTRMETGRGEGSMVHHNGHHNGRTTHGKKSELTLIKLFEDQLRDIYWAERQLSKSLPRLSKATDSDELRDAIENHISETEEQSSRLEQVFDLCELKPQAHKSYAMEGLIND